MNITNVTAFVVETPRRPLVFARIDTDTGTYGIGEADATSSAVTVARRIVELGTELVGTDPHDRESILAGAYSVSVLIDSGLQPGANDIVNTAAISALDIGMWDLVAKNADRPLYDVLGGTSHGRELPVYANGWWQDCYRTKATEPGDFADRAAKVVDNGYDGLKLNPFGYDEGLKSRSTITTGIERVKAVRETVGSETDLLVEGHKQFMAAQAVQVARRLEPSAPTFFEEPTPPSLRALETVSAASPIPVATGESAITHHAFGDLVATDVAVFQPDPLRTGGVTATKKVASLADSVGVHFAPHNACGSVGTAVSAHLATSCPSFTLLEVFEDYAYPEWVHALYQTDLEVTDGKLTIAAAPGHGVDLDFEALEARGTRYE